MGFQVFSLIMCTIAFLMDIGTAIDQGFKKKWRRMIMGICLTILMGLCICANIVAIDKKLDNAAHGGNEIETSNSVQD